MPQHLKHTFSLIYSFIFKAKISNVQIFGSRWYFKCFKVSSALQGYIYLIKNTVKIVKYNYNLNSLFSMWIYVKMSFIFRIKSEFSASFHYTSLSVTRSFRNHSNMLICCLIIISDNYQCWKQLICLWKQWHILFFRIIWWIERTAFIWNRNIL